MKYLLLFIFVFALKIATAQDYKFGKVSKGELQETSDPTDSEANATEVKKLNSNI